MSGHSVWVKVGLYTFDIGSDWFNGGLMLQCPVNLTINETIPTLDTINDTDLSKDDGCEPWWGSITIAMSWIPPTIIFLIYISGSIRKNMKKGKCFTCWEITGHLLLGPVIYALWPLLVPIGICIDHDF